MPIHANPPNIRRELPRQRWTGMGVVMAMMLGCIGCGEDTPGEPIQRRSGALLIEGCAIDEGQRQSLESSALRSVISTAILLCPAIHEGGALPREADAMQVLSSSVSYLRARGLRVELGITARDDSGQELPPTRLAALLRDPVQRDLTATAAAQFDARADGLVVALPALPQSSESDVTAWVQALAAWTPGRKPSIFAPPSSEEPSDLPQGSAVNLRTLASSLRSVYAMTVDYSCCEGTPGPTTDADWTAQVVSLAHKQSSQTPLYMTQPLYGFHFIAGSGHPVSYLTAAGLASARHLQILRTDEGSLQYSFQDEKGARNEVWFDDARSIAGRMARLDDLVGAEVGVLYYGLGGEDPALWSTLQGRTQ